MKTEQQIRDKLESLEKEQQENLLKARLDFYKEINTEIRMLEWCLE